MDTSTLEAVGEHPLIGALINDRYVVDSVIGKGSSGIVYKATRLLMGREVAVKVLHSYLGAEVGALDRFLREARAASRLRHPHIINIWESGVTDDAQPYFVMDYLEGMTLADLVRQKGYLHAGRAMPIITQICEALGEAHRQNIIHRDIKPENIVLETNEGDNNFDDYVKVLDFGIADAPAGTPGVARVKTAAGSPAYMSPEQCQGFELDQRSDIYSLAIVIFEMLTGMRPFAADDVMKLFYMHVSQPPPTLSSMRSDLRFPMQVELAVAKALAKNPDNRQQSIKEFHKDLEDAFASSDMNAGKRESVTVDLFSLPVGDRLTDGGGSTSTGSHNFLPGPEDWEEPAEVSDPAAPAAAPVAKSEGPDVSAAVNRLLKSAKRASEAVKKEDVGTWAKDVLTRNDGQADANKEAPKPVKASGGQGPPENSGPEVSNWAHKVLNRQNTGDMPAPSTTSSTGAPASAPSAAGTRPAQPSSSAPSVAPKAPQPATTPSVAAKTPASVPAANTPPAPVARSNFAGAGAPDAQTTQTKQGGKIAKPIEFGKAKSAADAARRNSGEVSKQLEEPVSPAAATVMPSLERPANAEPPVPKVAANNVPPVSTTPPASKTLSMKPAEQAALMKRGEADSDKTAASAAPPAVAKSGNSEASDLSFEIDSLLGDIMPAEREPSAPAPKPTVPQAKPSASLPNATTAKPSSSIPNVPLSKPSSSLPNAAQAKPSTSIPNIPLQSSAAPAKSNSSIPNIPLQSSPAQAKPSTSIPNIPLQSNAAQAKPSTSIPNIPLQSNAAAKPSASAQNIQPKPSIPAAKPLTPKPAVAAESETTSPDRSSMDLSRFEQPVNKSSEPLNPFAQAIDGLLDAAIMPKTQEDVRRSANKLKKMDAPESEAVDPLDPNRFEMPINSRASFDPSRFENPINRESLPDTVSQNNARYEQPINKGGISSGSTAGSKMLGASDAERKAIEPKDNTSIDLNRFEHPINRAEESLNPFAQAVDGLLDSARIKPEPKPIMASSTDLGETAAAVGKPPDAAAIEALDSTAEEDRVHDAVSRLIEAAKRSPEPVAKPEVLNKKIEAVKKKIEALKAADVAKPVTSGLPPEVAPLPAGTPTPFVPGPNDSNSLSDAVNRLLEAAQRQETTTNAPALPPQMANPFADAYSSPSPPTSYGSSSSSGSSGNSGLSSGSSGLSSGSASSSSSQTNVPVSNPFDAGASTSMVNPFAQVKAPDPSSSGTFKQSANAPAGPAAPDPSKKPPEGSAFQNYVSAPTDRMTRAAELINNAIKSSKTPEVAQDYYSGFKSDPKQIQAERAETLKKSRQRVRKNFQGPPKPPFWVLLIIFVAVGVGAAMYLGYLPNPMVPAKNAAPLTVDQYIKQGKFEKARELLEAKKKPLTQSESDKLYNCYYQIGLKEGKDENFQDAVKDLKLIPRKSDLYTSAASKIREYKKKMSDL
ncbi:MAG: protein kinase [Cyanobacteria bacterium SZAS-4]|nr:protein kinase [Cyanobacteria bacterium SZAS-4]